VCKHTRNCPRTRIPKCPKTGCSPPTNGCFPKISGTEVNFRKICVPRPYPLRRDPLRNNVKDPIWVCCCARVNLNPFFFGLCPANWAPKRPCGFPSENFLPGESPHSLKPLVPGPSKVPKISRFPPLGNNPKFWFGNVDPQPKVGPFKTQRLSGDKV